jgi:hypothetical protein
MLTSKELGISKALLIFKITGVGNNQTDNPMVSPERFSVSIHGGTMFPKEGKAKASSGKNVPSLVLSVIDAIDTESTEGPLRKKNNTHYKSKKRTIKQTFPQ